MSGTNIMQLRQQVSNLQAKLDRIMEGLEGTCMTCEPVGVRNQQMQRDIKTLQDQRDEARLQLGRIVNEIDCRIEHGADSNGHLEAILSLFKDNTNA